MLRKSGRRVYSKCIKTRATRWLDARIEVPSPRPGLSRTATDRASTLQPATTKIAAAMPSGFEFITFGNLDEMRDDTTISQIRRHAMRDVGAARRLPNSRRSRQRLLRPGPSHAAHDADAPPLPGGSSQAGPEAGATDVAPTSPARTSAREGRAPSEALTASTLGSRTAQSLSWMADPFNSAPIAVDSTVHTLMQYFIYHYHENGNWVYETGWLPPDRANFRRHVTQKADLAFHDEFAMLCTLSAAATRIRTRDGVRSAEIQRQRELSLYKATRMLQGRIDGVAQLSAQSAADLTNCIGMLGCAELFNNQVTAARVHVSGIAALVESLGGIAAVVDDYTRGAVLALDMLLACQTLQPCLMSGYIDPGPFRNDLALRDLQLSSSLDEKLTGSALLNTPNRHVPEPTKDLVRALIEVREVSVTLETAPDWPRETARKVRRWIRLRTAATRVTLLAIASSDPVVEAVRVALIMQTLLRDLDRTRGGLVKRMAQRLRQILASCSGTDWRACKDVKLWVLLMGYSCAGDGTEEKHWFFAAVLREWTTMNGDLSEHEDSGAILDKLLESQSRFFFHEQAQRASMEQLARLLAV